MGLLQSVTSAYVREPIMAKGKCLVMCPGNIRLPLKLEEILQHFVGHLRTNLALFHIIEYLRMPVEKDVTY